MSETCLSHIRNTFKTCPEHVRNMCETCTTHVRNMSGTCAKHVRHMCETCAKHVRNMSGTFSEHVRNMCEDHKTCLVSISKRPCLPPLPPSLFLLLVLFRVLFLVFKTVSLDPPLSLPLTDRVKIKQKKTVTISCKNHRVMFDAI